MERFLDNAEHWRKRAKETLVKAETLSSPAKERLLKVVKEYEELARRAELGSHIPSEQ
jgi:hypothetical protein